MVLNVPRHYSWLAFRLRVRDWPRSCHLLLHVDTHIFRLLSQGEVVEVRSEVRVVGILHWGLLLRLWHCRHCGTECLVETKCLFGIIMQGYLLITTETLIETIAHRRNIEQITPTVLPIEWVVKVGVRVSIIVTNNWEARRCLILDLLLSSSFLFALCFVWHLLFNNYN